MKRIFKFRVINKLSCRRRNYINNRALKYALKLKVLHQLVDATTEEELNLAIERVQSEVNELMEIINSKYWARLPRKAKKKEKQAVCDFYNAYTLIPNLLNGAEHLRRARSHIHK